MKKKEIVFWGIVIGLPIAIIVVLILLLQTVVIPAIQLANSPEQSAQVEVIGKRISKDSSFTGKLGGYSISYTYIIAFRFPDGSVKELKVGFNSTDDSKKEVRCIEYDSIHEGDTGMLVYKERENIEQRVKNESARYNGRRFISFKIDGSSTIVKDD